MNRFCSIFWYLLCVCSPLPATDLLPLSLMSFNIRYGTADDGENRWTNRRDHVFQLIRERQPDLLGLQEALRFQIDEMLAAMPEYAMIGVGRDDGVKKGEHAAILYRQDRFQVSDSGTFWLSDTPEIAGSKSFGNKTTRICTWSRFVDKETRRGIYFYNVHIKMAGIRRIISH